MKKHDTRRKGIAKIKHKVFNNHCVPNQYDDDDTPVPNVDDDNIDDFVLGYHWEGSYRIEVLIKKDLLKSIGVKVEEN